MQPDRRSSNRRGLERDERVSVVTGASAGIGRAIARAFGERGCKVALIARTREALENAAIGALALAGGSIARAAR